MRSEKIEKAKLAGASADGKTGSAAAGGLRSWISPAREAVIVLAGGLLVVTMGWLLLGWFAGKSRFELMGELGLPNRCSLDVEGSIDRSRLRVEMWDTRPRRQEIFDGRRCSGFVEAHGLGDNWGFSIRYLGEEVCLTAQYDDRRRGGDHFRIRCRERPNGVSCSVWRSDGPMKTSCRGDEPTR